MRITNLKFPDGGINRLGFTIALGAVGLLASALVCKSRKKLSGNYILNNGRKLPCIGLGTWKSKPGEVKKAVECALRAGYRHIDCAPVYGNQKEVGEAFATVFSEGKLKRRQVFVCSKVFPKITADKFEQECRNTLRELGLEYLDLYLIHWPLVDVASIKDMWAAMEQLLEKGLVKSIGVSNFSKKKLMELMVNAKVVPAVNQVELHPNWRQDELFEYCSSKGIHLTAYCPLGSPDQFSPDGLNREATGPLPLQNSTVVSIAKECDKTAAQVLLKWAVQRGTSVVPKSVTPARIIQNFEAVQSWELSATHMKALNAFLPQYRLLHGAFHTGPKRTYKTLTELWDEDVSYLEGRTFEKPTGFKLQ
ncbi:hypothetical protein CYMTET_42995 [Cymbomonas tetramitiformis]|uniref:NADP-dependent oxidoreductase domain-containing protein n=1 Tax=Cymbomonas tetramitiformis TaxID=36881 RepID=A0AAE0F0P9_9CHLO|nr:hypothetical protein CYMTET_42995 [Cymbomonas tetramitiformis]